MQNGYQVKTIKNIQGEALHNKAGLLAMTVKIVHPYNVQYESSIMGSV